MPAFPAAPWIDSLYRPRDTYSSSMKKRRFVWLLLAPLSLRAVLPGRAGGRERAFRGAIRTRGRVVREVSPRRSGVGAGLLWPGARAARRSPPARSLRRGRRWAKASAAIGGSANGGRPGCVSSWRLGARRSLLSEGAANRSDVRLWSERAGVDYYAISKFKTGNALVAQAFRAAPADPQLLVAWAGTLHGAEHMAAL